MQARCRRSVNSTCIQPHLGAHLQEGAQKFLDMNRTALAPEDRYPGVGTNVCYAHNSNRRITTIGVSGVSDELSGDGPTPGPAQARATTPELRPRAGSPPL